MSKKRSLTAPPTPEEIEEINRKIVNKPVAIPSWEDSTKYRQAFDEAISYGASSREAYDIASRVVPSIPVRIRRQDDRRYNKVTCVHLLGPTTQSHKCGGCGGGLRAIFDCEIHDTGTLPFYKSLHDSFRSCLTCDDYKPGPTAK